MPLDQSIVFDGAWRLLSGQKPFRDFVLPNGIAPMAIQVLFFKGLGVTWFSYCLHAALANGIFCVIVYALLRISSADELVALWYGLLSSIVFYPPFGVPFMDQHAFLFCLVAVLAARVASSAAGRTASLAAALLPIVFVAGMMSKQLPSALIPVLVTGALVADCPREGRRVLRGLALGGLASAALLAVGAAWAGVDWSLLWTYGVALPGGVGRARLAELAGPREFAETIVEVRRAWGMTSVELVSFAFALWLSVASRGLRMSGRWNGIALAGTGAALYFLSLPSRGRAAIAVAIFLVSFVPAKRLDTYGQAAREGLGPLILAESLVVVCLVHAALTYNQPHNAIPYAFVAAGLLHVGLLQSLPTGARAARAAVTVMLLVVTALDARSFEERVNVTRRVHKLNRRSVPLPADGVGLPAAMGFIRWQTPTEFAVDGRSLAQVVAFLQRASANFFLLGDSSILYALAGRASTAPTVWFHAGLTLPHPGTPAFASYERLLLRSLRRHHVRYVVLEDERTFLGTQLSDIPALDDLIRTTECERRQIGPFSIVTLCDSSASRGGPDARSAQ